MLALSLLESILKDMSNAEGLVTDEVTLDNFGALAMLTYAQFLRDYDNHQTLIREIKQDAASLRSLGERGVKLYGLVNTQLYDRLPKEYREVSEITPPKARALVLEALSVSLASKFSHVANAVGGFYNPSTNAHVVLPMQQMVIVECVGDRDIIQKRAGAKDPVHAVTGKLQWAELSPLPPSGLLWIREERTLDSFNVTNIIDRDTYAPNVSLTFLDRIVPNDNS